MTLSNLINDRNYVDALKQYSVTDIIGYMRQELGRDAQLWHSHVLDVKSQIQANEAIKPLWVGMLSAFTQVAEYHVIEYATKESHQAIAESDYGTVIAVAFAIDRCKFLQPKVTYTQFLWLLLDLILSEARKTGADADYQMKLIAGFYAELAGADLNVAKDLHQAALDDNNSSEVGKYDLQWPGFSTIEITTKQEDSRLVTSLSEFKDNVLTIVANLTEHWLSLTSGKVSSIELSEEEE